jgi:response regulator RpfG family c-di-GMP phosphodiesterase
MRDGRGITSAHPAIKANLLSRRALPPRRTSKADVGHQVAKETALPLQSRTVDIQAPPRILIVDDDDAVRDVISVILREEGYHCVVAHGAEMALDLAAMEETPLVISDMKMPGRDGLWLLDNLRDLYPDTAVIMLTGYGDTEAAVECLRRGAVDYLLKPPKVTNLIRAIERALAKRRIEMARQRYQKKLERKVKDRTAELRNALKDIASTYQNTLLALVSALDAREHETSDHSLRVVSYTSAIGERLGIRGQELEEIGRGALLHDIGKIGVPDAVLLKPGKLNPTEWIEMRKHPEIGHQMIQAIPFLSTPAGIVLSHQERFDGGGYPRKLRGDEIPVGARIFAVADTLDAMTSDRPYRQGTSFANAVGEIVRCAGTQFDPEVVKAFADIGEAGLQRIKQQMQLQKAISVAEADARADALERDLITSEIRVEELLNRPPPRYGHGS